MQPSNKSQKRCVIDLSGVSFNGGRGIMSASGPMHVDYFGRTFNKRNCVSVNGQVLRNDSVSPVDPVDRKTAEVATQLSQAPAPQAPTNYRLPPSSVITIINGEIIDYIE